jgi:hypothetical protein
MLHFLGFSLRIVHHKLDRYLAVQGLINSLDKLVEILVGGEERELFWSVSTAVRNNSLPLDIPTTDKAVEELAEVGSILSQILDDISLKCFQLVS